MNSNLFLGCLLYFYATCTGLSFSNKKAEDPWFQEGQETLKRLKDLKPNYNVAKNVIIFVGDGMGPSSVTAGRIYRGQREGRLGEGDNLSFDSFPHVALSKTYTTDKMVGDSSATGTAILCGVKTPYHTLGLDSTAVYENCSSQFGAEVDSILAWSIKEGKSGGIVTNMRLTHATPSSAYAHSVSRYWEVDYKMPPEDRELGCKDIASQLVENGADIQVLLGGGSKYFLPRVANSTSAPTGARIDNRDLIQEWKDKQASQGRRYRYIDELSQLDEVQPDNTDYLLGMFGPSNLPFDIDIEEERETGPRLKDLTRKAIQMLQKNDKGFFLLVEGGLIDYGHHMSRAKRALSEVAALHDAVQVADDMTDDSDTLLVVTADHSHVFTIGSYTSRGVDILGLSDGAVALDGKPVTTLLYGNGPGGVYGDGSRQDLTGVNITGDPDYKYQGAVPMRLETHGGEDVAIYAKGPMAQLFSGVVEQNYIAHAMAYASCVGANQDHCKYGGGRNGARSTSTGGLGSLLLLLLLRVWVLWL